MTNRPLRVFHLIKGLGRGGAEMLLTDGPRTSDPTRFTYGFGYFLPHKNALVSEIEASIAKVECFAAKGPLAMSGKIVEVARHVRRWQADILHCHLPLAGVVGRLAGRLAGVPIVYTEHNSIERYHPATRVVARATWPLQKHVIAVSSDVADSVRRHFGERVPVTLVSNGVSVERFGRSPEARAATRRELGIADDSTVIGTVAVFRTQKRLDLWLQVASAVRSRRPAARFLLVGDGPLRADVENRLAASGLGECVILTGLKKDVRPYLAAMDAYLMTSDFEGLPIALLEAMASELIPITTDAGGCPEAIQDGVSGFVVPKGDVAGLERRLLEVLDASPEQRAGYAAAARRRVAERFSTQRMMRQIEQVYSDVVARR